VDPFAYRGLVDVLKLPVDTPIGTAFAKHRERVERYRREHPNATAQRADTFERVVVLQQRLADAKAAFRRSIGYAEENELRQVLGEHYDAMRPRVRQKLDEIRALRERLSVER
jgi:hypothetical protein